jgi:hypothetical protein
VNNKSLMERDVNSTIQLNAVASYATTHTHTIIEYHKIRNQGFAHDLGVVILGGLFLHYHIL